MSHIKRGAVYEALLALKAQCRLSTVEVDTERDAQPFGFAATSLGAHERARLAVSGHTDAWGIGIESGVVFAEGCGYYDVAVVAVVTPDGRTANAVSAGIPFPVQDVDEARRRGFATTTVGDVIAARLGGSAQNPHQTLTAGRVNRQDTLVVAITAALAQLMAAPD